MVSILNARVTRICICICMRQPEFSWGKETNAFSMEKESRSLKLHPGFIKGQLDS